MNGIDFGGIETGKRKDNTHEMWINFVRKSDRERERVNTQNYTHTKLSYDVNTHNNNRPKTSQHVLATSSHTEAARREGVPSSGIPLWRVPLEESPDSRGKGGHYTMTSPGIGLSLCPEERR